MNKILWLVNPITFVESDLEYPQYISSLNNSRLTVLLLDEYKLQPLMVVSNDPMFPTVEYRIPTLDIPDNQSVLFEEGKQRILKSTQEKNISLVIHDGTGDAGNDIVVESMFSDLILVKSTMSFNFADTNSPSDFLLHILPKVECPVLILPDEVQSIDEVVFTYNGSYSSIYAIRQFTYLFPQLSNVPVTVLYVAEEEGEIKHQQQLKELLYQHYENISFKILQGDPVTAIQNELISRKNIVASFGALGRNKLSNFFKKSNADNIVNKLHIPLFITHP
ncbi:MAG: universal stress protein [Ferruginibacter sp.]